MKPRTLIGMLIAGDELRDLMESQTAVLAGIMCQREIENLESARHSRDMLLQFLVALDEPDTHDQLREVLLQAHADMSDHVARIEEHVG